MLLFKKVSIFGIPDPPRGSKPSPPSPQHNETCVLLLLAYYNANMANNP